MENQACNNTDKEIWREKPGDYYSDSIHVTGGGEIGINCGGHVYVMPVRKWHELASLGNKPTPKSDAGMVEAIDALKKYGSHWLNCTWWDDEERAQSECSCGFDEALASLPKQKNEGGGE